MFQVIIFQTIAIKYGFLYSMQNSNHLEIKSETPIVPKKCCEVLSLLFSFIKKTKTLMFELHENIKR